MQSTNASFIPSPQAGPAKLPGEQPLLARHEAATIFEALDADGDSAITRDEFITALRNNPVLAGVLNVPTRYEQDRHVDKIFDAIDVDGSGTLDMQEFLTYYCPGTSDSLSPGKAPPREPTSSGAQAPETPPSSTPQRNGSTGASAAPADAGGPSDRSAPPPAGAPEAAAGSSAGAAATQSPPARGYVAVPDEGSTGQSNTAAAEPEPAAAAAAATAAAAVEQGGEDAESEVDFRTVPHLSKEEATRVFQALDTNHDGSITQVRAAPSPPPPPCSCPYPCPYCTVPPFPPHCPLPCAQKPEPPRLHSPEWRISCAPTTPRARRRSSFSKGSGTTRPSLGSSTSRRTSRRSHSPDLWLQ